MTAISVKDLVRVLLDLKPGGDELVYVRGEAGTRWPVTGAVLTGGLGSQVVLTVHPRAEEDPDA